MGDVLPGTVLGLEKGDWSLGSASPASHPVFLRVHRVRHELARYYDYRKVWVEGIQLARDGTPMSPLSLLVDTAALTKVARPAPIEELPTGP